MIAVKLCLTHPQMKFSALNFVLIMVWICAFRSPASVEIFVTFRANRKDWLLVILGREFLNLFFSSWKQTKQRFYMFYTNDWRIFRWNSNTSAMFVCHVEAAGRKQAKFNGKLSPDKFSANFAAKQELAQI